MSIDIDRPLQEEKLRHVVAGMLSTINFVPAQTHPEATLDTADLVILHVRRFDEMHQQSHPGAVTSVPQGPKGPTEGPERY